MFLFFLRNFFSDCLKQSDESMPVDVLLLKDGYRIEKICENKDISDF